MARRTEPVSIMVYPYPNRHEEYAVNFHLPDGTTFRIYMTLAELETLHDRIERVIEGQEAEAQAVG